MHNHVCISLKVLKRKERKIPHIDEDISSWGEGRIGRMITYDFVTRGGRSKISRILIKLYKYSSFV